MRTGLMLLAVLFGGAFSTSFAGPGKARHVVVVVWSGMRPDFVTGQNTPVLWQLALQGTSFDNHHSVYVSSTEANAAAIATGDDPGHSGIITGNEFRPQIDAAELIHTDDFATVRKGDSVSRDRYVMAPTMAEILQHAGFKTCIAGANPAALLLDRADRGAFPPGINLFAGQTLPPNVMDAVAALLGAFPRQSDTNRTQDNWTTSALTDSLWKDEVPEFSLLWLNEPGDAQQSTCPGSKAALAAIKSADDNLARVLHVLEEKGVRGSTDIMVMSDHGFSTILSTVDTADSLVQAGFYAVRKFEGPPANGDVLVVSSCGSSLIYVANHDEKTIRQLVRFFQAWNYTGVIFTRRPVEGAFTLAQARIDSPAAPDVIVSLRWTTDKNDAGVPGMIFSDLTPSGPGQGMHFTLSRFDMHNMLIAAGPDFRAGVVDHLPTGNVDIAPTVLWILGVTPPKPMDGRVLTEALTADGPKIKSFEPGHLGATMDQGKSVWRQYLNFTEVNGVPYFDEGNGAVVPK